MAGPKTPEAEPTTPTAPSAPKSAGRRKATASKEKEPAPGSMPQGDVDFLIACLQNTVSGNIQVDLQKIAEARGFTNLGSVRNRMAAIKSKYNITMIASTKSTVAGTGDNEEVAPAVKTPKGKVTKPKATSAQKNTPTTRSKKRKAEEEAQEEEEADNDDDMAVKFPGLEKEIKAKESKAKETKTKETKKPKDSNKKVKETKDSKEETEVAEEEVKKNSEEDAEEEADTNVDADADTDTILVDENA